ncbi:Thiamine-phosphate synthase [Stieleria bergensis]|uniref:Thiamine-phosphate synthase n=1 Tax=Stieleria bergensis TaxID=2528025 RepID=A0A517SNR3_9BACT|nr:Thiamine-phosphate synthase [Planctomycetes bacterium SV_7m_r]
MTNKLHSTYRILDASANRACEGIRTTEEYARFVLDDSQLATDAKAIRHGITAALSRLPPGALLQARDTRADVGTTIQLPSEYDRQTTNDVLAAAAARVQQSLRVLEEYGKTIDAQLGQQFESLRYQSYSLMQNVLLQSHCHQRVSRINEARLYLLIECQSDEASTAKQIEQLAESGVDVFQLRDKQATDRELYRHATAAAAATERTNTLLIINDRVDIAAATNADGVHLGQDELPVSAARTILGPEKLIGLSTHDTQQVQQAIEQGVSYIGCGPTFPSTTKSFSDFAGTQFLSEAAQLLEKQPVPAFAIGGITENNLTDVLQTGFERIAVSGAISKSDAPNETAKSLSAQLHAVTN